MEKKSEEQSTKSLRILTYNFFLLNPLQRNNYTGDCKDQRIDDFAKNHFKDYDIICFQEVWYRQNWRTEKIIELGKKYGFDYCSISPMPTSYSKPNYIVLPIIGFINTSLQSWPQENAGLVTISRYPIKQSQFQGFDHGAQEDKLCWKGILYSQIEIDTTTKQTLHLFTTHLQAQYVYFQKDAKLNNKDLENGMYQLQTKITQICQIRDFIETIYREKSIIKNDKKNIVALCGDLNIDARGDEIPSEYLIKVHPYFEKYRERLEKNKNGPISFSEYDYIMDIFSGDGVDKVINLSLESYGEHKVTNGDIVYDENGNKMPAETFLSCKEDQMQEMCLDYCLIFQKDKGKDPRDYDEALERTIKSCKVNTFKIENRRYTHLSDHYGLEYCLEMPEL